MTNTSRKNIYKRKNIKGRTFIFPKETPFIDDEIDPLDYSYLKKHFIKNLSFEKDSQIEYIQAFSSYYKAKPMNLYSIDLTNCSKLKYLGYDCMFFHNELQEIKFPKNANFGLETLCLRNTNITNIDCSHSQIEYVKDNAFLGCKKLSTLDFSNCPNLKYFFVDALENDTIKLLDFTNSNNFIFVQDNKNTKIEAEKVKLNLDMMKNDLELETLFFPSTTIEVYENNKKIMEFQNIEPYSKMTPSSFRLQMYAKQIGVDNIPLVNTLCTKREVDFYKHNKDKIDKLASRLSKDSPELAYAFMYKMGIFDILSEKSIKNYEDKDNKYHDELLKLKEQPSTENFLPTTIPKTNQINSYKHSLATQIIEKLYDTTSLTTLEKEKLINKLATQPVPELAYKFIESNILGSSNPSMNNFTCTRILSHFERFKPEININVDFANFFVKNFDKIIENHLYPNNLTEDSTLCEINNNFNLIVKNLKKEVSSRSDKNRLELEHFKCKKFYPNIMQGKTYEETQKYEELAFLAGTYRYEDCDFTSVQDLFTKSKELIDKQILEIIPDPLVEKQKENEKSDEDKQIKDKDKKQEITYEFIAKDNPKGIFLGDITNCCQTLEGAGESCMYNGMLDPNSGFIAFKLGEEIIGQSWVWYSEDQKAIALDNIEIPDMVKRNINSNYFDSFNKCLQRITDNFTTTMQEKGKEVNKIVIGNCNTDIKFHKQYAFTNDTMVRCDRPIINLYNLDTYTNDDYKVKYCYSDVSKEGQYILLDKNKELLNTATKNNHTNLSRNTNKLDK